MNEIRVIDANALAKKLDELSDLLRGRALKEEGGWLAVQAGITLAMGEVDEAPTVEGVCVVRCCECRYGVLVRGDVGEGAGMTCMVHDRDVDYVDYCSRAERREVDYND